MNAVLVAAALDLAVGEPPSAAHPVVWMGRYLSRVGRRLPAGPAPLAEVMGGLAWAVGAAGLAGAAALVQPPAHRLPSRSPRRQAAVLGGALWTLGSGRLLFAEVAEVERALDRGLDAGRERLSRIVSRDTRELAAQEVRASALESLAENLSDSIVAPLFWYCLGGLPAAAVYRFTNTADAVWGYRTPRWEHAGKVAARVDDLLNVVPARLTAALLLVSAGARPRAWARLAGEARRTSSPNGGWPMGALALALNVRLPKPGYYVLNRSGRAPGSADTRIALRLAARTAALATVLAAGAERVGRRSSGRSNRRSSRHHEGAQ